VIADRLAQFSDTWKYVHYTLHLGYCICDFANVRNSYLSTGKLFNSIFICSGPDLFLYAFDWDERVRIRPKQMGKYSIQVGFCQILYC
jgi:hypothetical protein